MSEAPGTDRCASCDEELVAGARFCEACGQPTGLEPATTEPGTDPGTVACADCGATVGDDGYCTACGMRVTEPVTTEERDGIAVATHRGRRHNRNEDSSATARTEEGWPVIVVTDGVSVSPNPHLAAAAAARAAADRLRDQPFGGEADLVAAVALAHEAACAISADGDPNWIADGSAPVCTIVVGVATADALHLANVGDARGYHLRLDGATWQARAATTDDSVAAQAIAAGVAPADALELPDGHAITGWLGRDAHGLAPHVAATPTQAGDVVLMCSDGLWNYAPTDEAMGEAVSKQLPTDQAASLGDAAERLVAWANDAGGADNICVALTRVSGGPPAGSEEEP